MGNEVMIKKRKIVGVLIRVKRYPHHSTILTPIETSSVTGSTNFRHVFAVKLKSFVIPKVLLVKEKILLHLLWCFMHMKPVCLFISVLYHLHFFTQSRI